MSSHTKSLTSSHLKTTLQTVAISSLIVLLAIFAGWQIIGGWSIAVVGGFGLAVAISANRTSSRVRLAGAREIRYMDSPELHGMVGELCRRAGIDSQPTLLYSRSLITNAATFGDLSNPYIVVTQGLLNALTPRELNGVLAHEIAHIRHGDQKLFRFAEVFRQATNLVTRIGWIALIFALPFMLFGYTVPMGGFLILIAAPLLSYLLEMALLRTREFAADLKAAELAGDPDALANALGKIQHIQQSFVGRLFPVYRQSEGSIFRSHPDTAERIRRLRELT